MGGLVKAASTWFLAAGTLALVLCGVVMTGCAQAGQMAANSEVSSEAVDDSGKEATDVTAKQAGEGANQQKESNDSTSTSGENTSGDRSASEPATETKPVPVNDAETPNVAMANLGINVLRELDIANKNVMISPFSLSAALSLTANGAEGETRTELENALGLLVGQLNEAFEDYEALSSVVELSFYDRSGTENTYEQQAFSNAHSVWLGKKLLPQQSFLDIAADDYKAEVQVVDGTSDAAVINEWANDHTNGMIPTIVADDFQVDSQGLALINAIAFECAWRQPYFDSQVESGTFTSSAGESQDATFLHGEEWGYVETPHATGFVKNYADSRFAFAALLPHEGTTPEALLDEMSGEELCEALKNADAGQNVITVMPEFENTFEVTLNDTLKALGVRRAFEWGRADFAGLADAPLWIDKVLQKTYVSVDRIGTKAAAVTVELAAGAVPIEEPPPTVCLDRPFVYVIFETENTTPLFIGVVNSLE